MFPQESAGCSKLGRPNQEAEDDGWDDEDDDDWQPTPKVEEKKGSKDKKPAKDRAAASRKTMNPSPKVQIPFVVLFQRPKVYPRDRTGRMGAPLPGGEEGRQERRQEGGREGDLAILSRRI